MGNNITGGSNWVVVGINIGVLNGAGRRMESKDQVMSLCGSSVHSNHSKLSDITAGKLSVKSQFITHNSNKAMASEWHKLSTFGFHRVRKKLQQKQTYNPPWKYRVQNESTLGQQSISGKMVSWILWVWKPGYVKSGYILWLISKKNRIQYRVCNHGTFFVLSFTNVMENSLVIDQLIVIKYVLCFLCVV